MEKPSAVRQHEETVDEMHNSDATREVLGGWVEIAKDHSADIDPPPPLRTRDTSCELLVAT